MYMSGNSLQIFSIMMVFMLFKAPIQGLMNINSVFIKFETDGTRAKLRAIKLVYILMQFVLLGVGVWKVNAMGLLPYVPLLQFFRPYSFSPSFVYSRAFSRQESNIYFQDNEIGLVSLGIRAGAVGGSLLCFPMSFAVSYDEIRLPFLHKLAKCISYLIILKLLAFLCAAYFCAVHRSYKYNIY